MAVQQLAVMPPENRLQWLLASYCNREFDSSGCGREAGPMAETEYAERDGFQVTNKVFVDSPNALDRSTKRQITICNLFSNHQLAISDIVQLLDETYGHVVSVLIKHGYIHERRKRPRQSGKLERSGPACRMIC